MSLKNTLRRFPPVCLGAALAFALCGRLRLRRQYVDKVISIDDGRRFRVFRHLTLRSGRRGGASVLVVRFNFKRFSQRVNRFLSLIPIPLIGGFPGFHDKVWMVDENSGDWQGVYEWESAEAVERYCASFVLGVINRRADSSSISYTRIPHKRLVDYLEGRIEATASSMSNSFMEEDHE